MASEILDAAMEHAAAQAPEQEIIHVSTKKVSCDGGGALGHPKVFYDMGEDTSVECKYCDRLFVLMDSA